MSYGANIQMTIVIKNNRALCADMKGTPRHEYVKKSHKMIHIKWPLFTAIIAGEGQRGLPPLTYTVYTCTLLRFWIFTNATERKYKVMLEPRHGQHNWALPTNPSQTARRATKWGNKHIFSLVGLTKDEQAVVAWCPRDQDSSPTLLWLFGWP